MSSGDARPTVATNHDRLHRNHHRRRRGGSACSWYFAEYIALLVER
jgi:hypothetical protein